jgi:PQQ-like domain
MKPGPKRLGGVLIASACGVAIGAAAVTAQGRGGGEWTTSQGDAQRSSWVRTDVRLTKDAVQKGELKFLWKMKLDNEARQLNSLTTPVLMDRLISHRGFKALAFVGASAERVYAIDTDLAKVYWTTVINYSSITPPANSTWACPGGLIAAVTRPTSVSVSAFGGGGGGRGGRSGSSVGEPGKGAPSLALVGQGRGAAPGDPAPAGRGAAPGAPGAAPAGRGGGGGLGGGPTDTVIVVASDGYARTINPHNGSDRVPAVPFLPANARPSALISVDGVLYTSTSHGCGATPNAVWAIDLASDAKKPVSWRTNGGNVAGTAGPTFGTDGTIFVAVGDSASSSGAAASTGAQAYANAIVALEARTLKVKDSFTQPGADFNTSPVVFRYKDKDLMAVSGNDGRLYLLDGTSLKTPLYMTPKYSNAGAAGGLATWESEGTRWILAPAVGAAQPGMKVPANGPVTNGSIVAFKLVDQGGKLSLEPAWASRDLTSPAAPLVFNGVLFALSTGEHRPANASATAAARAKSSVSAVLYALDPDTGKELWSSGKTITSFARGGLSAAAGQVYLVTFDNTVYAFGIAMEH